MQDVGKKQVAAILGVQSARAMTKPRPFLRLLPQNIAVQVTAPANPLPRPVAEVNRLHGCLVLQPGRCIRIDKQC